MEGSGDKCINVRFIDTSNSFDDSPERLLTILSIMTNPRRTTPLKASKKYYSYLSDMNLKVDDIVIVDAQGTISLAIVDSISDNTLIPNVRLKRILGRVEFPKGIVRNQRKNQILNSLYRMVPKDALAECVLETARNIQSEKIHDLIAEYNALSCSDSVKI